MQLLLLLLGIVALAGNVVRANNATEIAVDTEARVELAKKDRPEEILVSVSGDDLKSRHHIQGKLLWQVRVEIEKEPSKRLKTLAKKSTNTTLLNVMIVQDHEVKEFQLPSMEVGEQEKRKMPSFFLRGTRNEGSTLGFKKNQAMARKVTMCPGKEIDEESRLQIILVSTSEDPIEVTVRASLVEEGGGWERKEEGAKKWMQISSKLEFSNPLIQTVLFDQLNYQPNEVDHYMHLRIESAEDSPCFCSLLSVQRAECPYCDTLGDAQLFGRWQTMDQTTSMVIDASEFVRDRNYQEGKFLIVVIGVDDEVCNFQDIEGRRNKCEKRKP